MDGVAGFLLTQGVLGIVALVEGAVIMKIYAELKAAMQKVIDLQEARRVDAAQTRDSVTSILPGISQSLQNISDKIEISKESRKGK